MKLVTDGFAPDQRYLADLTILKRVAHLGEEPPVKEEVG